MKQNKIKQHKATPLTEQTGKARKSLLTHRMVIGRQSTSYVLPLVPLGGEGNLAISVNVTNACDLWRGNDSSGDYAKRYIWTCVSW